jgi:hypothetical protein
MTQKIILTCLLLIGLHTISNSQSTAITKNSLVMDTILKQGVEYNYITPLVGNWNVIQIIYSMGGEKIVSQDTFKVESKMIGNFLNNAAT